MSESVEPESESDTITVEIEQHHLKTVARALRPFECYVRMEIGAGRIHTTAVDRFNSIIVDVARPVDVAGHASVIVNAAEFAEAVDDRFIGTGTAVLTIGDDQITIADEAHAMYNQRSVEVGDVDDLNARYDEHRSIDQRKAEWEWPCSVTSPDWQLAGALQTVARPANYRVRISKVAGRGFEIEGDRNDDSGRSWPYQRLVPTTDSDETVEFSAICINMEILSTVIGANGNEVSVQLRDEFPMLVETADGVRAIAAPIIDESDGDEP